MKIRENGYFCLQKVPPIDFLQDHMSDTQCKRLHDFIIYKSEITQKLKIYAVKFILDLDFNFRIIKQSPQIKKAYFTYIVN